MRCSPCGCFSKYCRSFPCWELSSQNHREREWEEQPGSSEARSGRIGGCSAPQNSAGKSPGFGARPGRKSQSCHLGLCALGQVTDSLSIFTSVKNLFPKASVAKYHKLGGFEQQKCVLSWFWRLEVQHQDVSHAPSVGSRAESFLSPLRVSGHCWQSLARGCITAIGASHHTAFFSCPCLCV